MDGAAGAVGGILGVDTTGGGTVQFCYNSGMVTTTNQPKSSKTTSAGIYGSTSGTFSSKMRNNYYLVESASFGACSGYKSTSEPDQDANTNITGRVDSIGQFESKTAEALKSAAVALALNDGAAGESTVWRMVSGSYPVLAWENVPGAEIPMPAAWDGTTTDTRWYIGHESESSYDISTPDQLAGLSELVNGGNTFAGKTINLTADMSLGGKEWTPIGINGIAFDGYEFAVGTTSFKGKFDGKRHTISGLLITQRFDQATETVGLFGTIENAEIKNVKVNLCIESSAFTIGGIVGCAFGGAVTDCSVAGTILGGEGSMVGGILGLTMDDEDTLYTVKVSRCFNAAEIKSLYVGGIVGMKMSNDYGVNIESTLTVQDCYKIGDLICTDGEKGTAGGIVAGFPRSDKKGTSEIKNCFNYTTIKIIKSAPTSLIGISVGGIVGGADNGEVLIDNCYTVPNDRSSVEAFFNGKGLTLLEQSEFTTIIGAGKLDASTWEIVSGALYPTLRYQ